MTNSLVGQRAIVTGSSAGIGAAIVQELAARGASVIVNYHSGEDRAQAIAKKITDAGGKAIVAQADVGDPQSVNALFEKTVKELGGVDILVANAGLQDDAPFLELTMEQWQKTLNTDLTGQFLCAQAAAKQFVKQGVQEKISRAAGKIICISSVHEIIPWSGHANYAASKGGIHMLMQTMAQELAGKKIRVNAIAPGAIKTDINKDVWNDPAKAKDLLKLIPYGYIGEPEHVAKPVAWLVSDEADYITGATLFIDGGMSLYPSFIGNG